MTSRRSDPGASTLLCGRAFHLGPVCYNLAMDTINKNLPRDVFLYLLSIVALGMLAINFGTLLFQFINIAFPDVITDQYQYWSSNQYYQAIRWSVSSLVIVFPVFLWVSRFLRKDMETNPEKRELKIRKWLLYLTLFIAGVVVIGDLIALVYNFMQGELTTRFVLKVASILLIAGSIFFYYLNELRDQYRSTKIFAWVISMLITVGIIAGFVVAGSPEAQRFNRFDEQRVQDLQTIQWQIVSYWQAKQKLPANLAELTDSISGFKAPVDPETQAGYEYQPVNATSFKLCTTFKTDSQDMESPNGPRAVDSSYGIRSSNWAHAAGYVCFDRTIDPDLFPKNPR